MKKLIITILAVFFFAQPVFAVPDITSIDGAVVDGESLVITGTGFGANALNIEWLGGASGNIATANGGSENDVFAASGWHVEADSPPAIRAPRYDDAQSHSHSMSIMAQRLDGSYFCDIYFDAAGFSAEEDYLYATWWTRYHIDTYLTTWQWKLWRWSNTTSATDNANLVMSSIYLDNEYFYVFCEDGNPSNANCYPEQDNSYRYAGVNFSQDKWYRVEVWWQENSAAAAEDAYMAYRVRSSSGLDVDGWGGKAFISRNTGITGDKRYFHLQNYLGNGITVAQAWVDDIYISDTQARVEICNANTYENATTCEIQPPAVWDAGGGSITVTLNKGSIANLTTGDYYLYVVDANGVASTGHQLIAESCALTGTITAATVESDIITGGKTIILTLTNDTWVATVGADNAITTALIAGVDSAQSEATGWDVEVKGNMVFGDVTRDSDTQVTILLGAEAAYDITASETITVTIPVEAVTSGTTYACSPTAAVAWEQDYTPPAEIATGSRGGGFSGGGAN